MMASAIYKSLCPLAGKQGYELRQVCGSSRRLIAASDKDMLRVLSVHGGALPRKLWSTVIACRQGRYFVIYRRCNRRNLTLVFTHSEFGPPKDGG